MITFLVNIVRIGLQFKKVSSVATFTFHTMSPAFSNTLRLGATTHFERPTLRIQIMKSS